MLDKTVLNTAARNILSAFAPTFEKFDLEYMKRARLYEPRPEKDEPYYHLLWTVAAKSKDRVDYRAVGEAVAAAAKAKGMKLKAQPVELIGAYKDRPLGVTVKFFMNSRFAGKSVKLKFSFLLKSYTARKDFRSDGYLNVQIYE